MDPEEFKALLRTESAEHIVDQYVLSSNPGTVVSAGAIFAFEEKMRAAFQVPVGHDVSAIVVGSAKLGFSFLEKRSPQGTFKPAYRSYEPGRSDVDVALVSPVIYGKIWQDLARYGSKQTKFPWRNDLAAHMFHGWLRPDKFPLHGLVRCDDWRRALAEVGRTDAFRYKKLRCGLYQSFNFLKLYQLRGILAAQAAGNTE